jgi:hypothetical protein
MLKRLSLLWLSLATLLLLSACGGGGDDNPTSATSDALVPTSTAAEATATAEPKATTEPTATSEPVDPTATSGANASPSPGAFTDAEAALLDLLLSAGDLSGEWDQLRVEAPERDEGSGICGAERFPGADERIAEVEVEYQSSDGSRFVLQNLTEFPEEVAAAAMDHVRETATCSEWTDESGVEFQIEPKDAPQVGDDAHALRVSFQVADAGTLEGDFTFIRVGGYVTIVTTLELGGYDPEDSANVAALAVAKLNARTAESITESEAALIGKLLSLDDMPGDWDQLAAAHRSDPESWTGLCDAELFAAADQAIARVAVDLYEGFEEESASLQQLLVLYPPEIAAEAFQHELDSADCDDFSRGGVEVELDVEPAFPTLGDESFATRFRFESDDETAEGLWIVIRSGDALTTLIFTDPDALDDSEVEELARIAVEKLEADAQ